MRSYIKCEIYEMTIGIVGKKEGMTRIIRDDGVAVPVTVISVEPNRVTQVKTVENDGYRALQVTAGSRRASRVTKPLSRHYAQAGTEATLSFKVGGQIRQIFVSVGETVRRGQPIASLDDEDLLLQLRQAEAGYAEASARDQKARAEFARTKILHENDATSDNQLESAETNALSARASEESARRSSVRN